jgi:hypothetical protein
MLTGLVAGGRVAAGMKPVGRGLEALAATMGKVKVEMEK